MVGKNALPLSVNRPLRTLNPLCFSLRSLDDEVALSLSYLQTSADLHSLFDHSCCPYKTLRQATKAKREPVWPSGKALGWYAERPRFDTASALLSL